MTTCNKCGLPVDFITIDGKRIPAHSCRFSESHNSFNGYSNSSYSLQEYSTHYSIYSSYTTPNAKCPVCNKIVYYYESEHGGKVFFDELGVPWPKHPCTDNKMSKRTPNIATTWKKNGWTPFWIENSFDNFGEQIIEGRILHKKSEQKICLSIHNKQDKKLIGKWMGNPTFIKRIKSKKNRYGHRENPTHKISTVIFDINIGFHGVEIPLVISYSSEYCS